MSSLTGFSHSNGSVRSARGSVEHALRVVFHVMVGCALGLVLSAASAEAQAKTFTKQRRYVTSQPAQSAAEIPVAPEGMPQADAAPAAPSEASPAPPAAPTPPAAVAPAPPPVAAPPVAPSAPPAAYAAPVYAQPAPAPAAPVYAAPPPVYAQPPVAPPPQVYVAPPMAPPPTWAAPAPAPRYVLVPIPVPQQVAPPPPPPAPSPDAQRAWVANQLAQVDSQLALLRREKKSIGGPIVQLTLGYIGTLVFTSVAVGSFIAAEEAEQEYSNDYNDWDHHYDEGDQDRLRTTGYVFTGLGVAALALGIAGTVRLARNSAINRGIKAESRSLLAQRASLRQQLSYGASALPGQVQLGVHGRF